MALLYIDQAPQPCIQALQCSPPSSQNQCTYKYCRDFNELKTSEESDVNEFPFNCLSIRKEGGGKKDTHARTRARYFISFLFAHLRTHLCTCVSLHLLLHLFAFLGTKHKYTIDGPRHQQYSEQLHQHLQKNTK